MTQEKISKCNKLIANFDGLKIIKVLNVNTNKLIDCWESDLIKKEIGLWVLCDEAHRLRYHLSWDWLIPVCKKFVELEVLKPQRKSFNYHCKHIGTNAIRFEIEALFIYMYLAIEWYNHNNPQSPTLNNK